MGETDYKDEEWTEKDWEELRQAGLEGQRKRAREEEEARQIGNDERRQRTE